MHGSHLQSQSGRITSVDGIKKQSLIPSTDMIQLTLTLKMTLNSI